MKQKIKSILTKNFFNISCLIFITISIINAFQVKKLRSEISILKETITYDANKKLFEKSKANFLNIEKDVYGFFDYISKTYLIKQQKNQDDFKSFKAKESQRLINVYDQNEEEFFKEFESVTDIERVK
jgi:hypothetical protein